MRKILLVTALTLSLGLQADAGPLRRIFNRGGGGGGGGKDSLPASAYDPNVQSPTAQCNGPYCSAPTPVYSTYAPIQVAAPTAVAVPSAAPIASSPAFAFEAPRPLSISIPDTIKTPEAQRLERLERMIAGIAKATGVPVEDEQTDIERVMNNIPDFTVQVKYKDHTESATVSLADYARSQVTGENRSK